MPAAKSPLDVFLTPKLPVTVSVQDSSLSVLCLLRVLHALNRYWYTLYSGAFEAKPILPQQVNNIVALSKTLNRQIKKCIFSLELIEVETFSFKYCHVKKTEIVLRGVNDN